MSAILTATESVCPQCLSRIPAQRVAEGDDIYLQKCCPDHGSFKTIIWRGQPAYTAWVQPKLPSYPIAPLTSHMRGCPFDCGLCPEHRQHSCCVLLEVTQRCDLNCPVCFANANCHPPRDPDLVMIEGWYRRVREASGPVNIQLSGGEPCVRDDLPEIAALGRELGFSFFQVNTNGLRLARDPAYVRRLKQAGVATIFLQFDGTNDTIYQSLRGRALFAQKVAAIEHCAEAQLGVVLVPTLVPGINTDNIGAIIRFALERMPAVRGVHFQPISYFGRYPQPPTDDMRITIPEVIRAIAAQTNGALAQESFVPPGGENALCSFHGNFVLMPDGKLAPLTHHGARSCCTAIPAEQGARRSRAFVAKQWAAPTIELTEPSEQPSLGGWDTFLARAQTHLFCISGMAFQDAWTLDLERLRDCYIHSVSPDSLLIPFCAYNLTAQDGRALYRGRRELVDVAP